MDIPSYFYAIIFMSSINHSVISSLLAFKLPSPSSKPKQSILKMGALSNLSMYADDSDEDDWSRKELSYVRPKWFNHRMFDQKLSNRGIIIDSTEKGIGSLMWCTSILNFTILTVKAMNLIICWGCFNHWWNSRRRCRSVLTPEIEFF